MNTTDWQTWAALGVVLFTAVVFAVKSAKKKSGSCGSCGCGAAHPKKPLADHEKHVH